MLLEALIPRLLYHFDSNCSWFSLYGYFEVCDCINNGVSENVMKCMYEYNHHKMYAWMQDAIQKDEISMRNKDNINACYVMYYKRFIGVWSFIRNSYDGLK